MPAAKAHRQSAKRYRRNGSVRTETRSSISKALRTLDAGEASDAATTVHAAISTIDRAVRKGVLHKNAGARRKSRLSSRLNKLQNA